MKTAKLILLFTALSFFTTESFGKEKKKIVQKLKIYTKKLSAKLIMLHQELLQKKPLPIFLKGKNSDFRQS